MHRRTYQRSAQLSSSCSTTGRAPLLRRTDPANRTDAKVRLPTVSEDIIMVRVRARRAGGQAVSSADQAARSARGKAWPFCTWDCFKNTALPLHRTTSSRRWLDGSVKDAASAACSFSLAEAAALDGKSRHRARAAGHGGSTVVQERADCRARDSGPPLPSPNGHAHSQPWTCRRESSAREDSLHPLGLTTPGRWRDYAPLAAGRRRSAAPLLLLRCC